MTRRSHKCKNSQSGNNIQASKLAIPENDPRSPANANGKPQFKNTAVNLVENPKEKSSPQNENYNPTPTSLSTTTVFTNQQSNRPNYTYYSRNPPRSVRSRYPQNERPKNTNLYSYPVRTSMETGQGSSIHHSNGSETVQRPYYRNFQGRRQQPNSNMAPRFGYTNYGAAVQETPIDQNHDMLPNQKNWNGQTNFSPVYQPNIQNNSKQVNTYMTPVKSQWNTIPQVSNQGYYSNAVGQLSVNNEQNIPPGFSASGYLTHAPVPWNQLDPYQPPPIIPCPSQQPTQVPYPNQIPPQISTTQLSYVPPNMQPILQPTHPQLQVPPPQQQFFPQQGYPIPPPPINQSMPYQPALQPMYPPNAIPPQSPQFYPSQFIPSTIPGPQMFTPSPTLHPPIPPTQQLNMIPPQLSYSPIQPPQSFPYNFSENNQLEQYRRSPGAKPKPKNDSSNDKKSKPRQQKTTVKKTPKKRVDLAQAEEPQLESKLPENPTPQPNPKPLKNIYDPFFYRPNPFTLSQSLLTSANFPKTFKLTLAASRDIPIVSSMFESLWDDNYQFKGIPVIVYPKKEDEFYHIPNWPTPENTKEDTTTQENPGDENLVDDTPNLFSLHNSTTNRSGLEVQDANKLQGTTDNATKNVPSTLQSFSTAQNPSTSEQATFQSMASPSDQFGSAGAGPENHQGINNKVCSYNNPDCWICKIMRPEPSENI